MVVHSAAQLVNYVPIQQVLGATVAAAGLWSIKAWAGGRKCIWEREWAGKMILIVGPPTTTVLALMDQLLRLPSPPQILYLPPYASPLPQELLTILHTLRLSTTNPQAELHCEPLPPTPTGVREFVRKWASAPQGMASESGRRIDAIVLADGWTVSSPTRDARYHHPSSTAAEDEKAKDEEPRWSSVHQFHFHLLTSLLPHLLRIQAERNIRIVSLVSPGWATALPSLQGTRMVAASPLQASGVMGLTTLLLMRHFQLILDTLASAAYGKSATAPVVPSGEDEERIATTQKKEKQRDTSVQSNIMAVSVVMPWCRGDVIRGIWGADETWLRWIMYMMWFPLLVIFTPSPAKSVQSILYALMAPVRYATPPPTEATPVGEAVESNRSNVAGGDTVRDCAIVDLPPVLCDPAVSKAHYEKIEKEVEAGVKQSQTREKAFPQPTTSPAPEAPAAAA